MARVSLRHNMYRLNGRPTWSLNRCAKRVGDKHAMSAAVSSDIRRSSDSRIASRTVVTRESNRRVGARPGLKPCTQRANECRDVVGLLRLFGERADLRHDRIQPRIRDDRDVLPKGCGQPGAFARFRIDEDHHPERAVAVERVLGVGSHDDAAALAPAVVAAADGDAAVERDHDLDRVVCVGGHDALSPGGEEEAALPQVPARDAQPAIRLVVRRVGQAPILAAPALAIVPDARDLGRLHLRRSRNP